MDLKAFTKELLEKLNGVTKQGQYKRQLAIALAEVVHAPVGHKALLYGNKLNELFSGGHGAWEHDNHEVVVDLVLMHRRDATTPWRIEAAAECEAFAAHNVELAGDDDTEDAGYFWDFWKLLHFRAPVRVFLAVTAPDKASTLRTNLLAYAGKYSDVVGRDERIVVAVIKNQDAAGWLCVDSAIHDGTKLRWDGGAETWLPASDSA